MSTSKPTRETLVAAGWFEHKPGVWVRAKQGLVTVTETPVVAPKLSARRIKQSTKPLLNKLEAKFMLHLLDRGLDPRPQALKFRIGNGVTYCPDLICFKPVLAAYEVKGAWMTDDAVVKLKTAATLYPEVQWILAWLTVEEVWMEQRVLP